MMDAKSFFDLVAKMREKQKEYFRTRSGSALSHSRDLEKRVDAEIDRVKKILHEKQNPTLF